MHLSEPVVRRILHPEFAVYGCPLQVPPRRPRRIVLDNYTFILFADEIGEMEFSIAFSRSPPSHQGNGRRSQGSLARKGAGKSGIRVIYFYVDHRGVVYLISAYAKTRKEKPHRR